MLLFDPPENIRKHLVFWYFQGDQKEKLERNGLTKPSSFSQVFLIFCGPCFTYPAITSTLILPKLTTALKIKIFIKDLFSKCDQISWKLRICSHLLKKSLTENLIFCAVNFTDNPGQPRLKSYKKAFDTQLADYTLRLSTDLGFLRN